MVSENYSVTQRPGTRIMAVMDAQVQSLWDRAQRATSPEERAALMKKIEEAGERQRGQL